jgi:hypothetical protein
MKKVKADAVTETITNKYGYIGHKQCRNTTWWNKHRRLEPIRRTEEKSVDSNR